MNEAITGITYLFRKFMNFVFTDFVIVSGVTVGYVLLAIAILGAIIGTLSPKAQGDIGGKIASVRTEKR